MNYYAKCVLGILTALSAGTASAQDLVPLEIKQSPRETLESVDLLEGDPQAGQLVFDIVEIAEENRIPLYNPATGIENFDSGFPDAYWEVGDLDPSNGADFWDDVTCNPLSGPRSAWAAGTGSQADCAFYDDNMETFMCVEAEYTGSSLNATDRFYFSFWNEVEACCDYMWISISGFRHEPRHGLGVCSPNVVGSEAFGSTSLCGGSCVCHNDRCWSRVRVRMGPGFDQTPFLRICFRFHSDESVRREGAYFDDIRFNGLSDTHIFPISGGFRGTTCNGTGVCGGIAGTMCPEGFECYFGPKANFPCGSADRTGLCRQYPPVCPDTNAPVCGCDGVTYRNECFAARSGAHVAHNGPCCMTNSECDSGEFCSRDDGECAGGGQCAPRPISCPGTIDRVCGCDGRTYDNRCEAHQAGVNVAHSGVCADCPGGPFTIGGAVYSDCDDPISTGIPDVRMVVTCGSSIFETNTLGDLGIWQLSNVPCGTCTVCPEKPGRHFAHVEPGCETGDECHTIVVNQTNQGANQSIQFLGMEADCMPFDLNGDGFSSIIGDVPLAVDCIYRNNCRCPEPGCLCPADCNCDGFLTIVGDVPCLVNCYYHQMCGGTCPPTPAATMESDSSADGRTIPLSAGTFTVGGAIFTDLDNPLSSGLTGVTVTLACVGRPDETTMTSSAQGLWSFANVPESTCTVTPARTGFCFDHVVDGTPLGLPAITITVDAAHEQQNQSIQFLASTDCAPVLGACCLPGGTCSMTLPQACVGRHLGAGLTCSGDPDDDGVVGCDDVCPSQAAAAGVDQSGRPLGDVTNDCGVGLDDYQILQNNFTGP